MSSCTEQPCYCHKREVEEERCSGGEAEKKKVEDSDFVRSLRNGGSYVFMEEQATACREEEMQEELE